MRDGTAVVGATPTAGAARTQPPARDVDGGTHPNLSCGPPCVWIVLHLFQRTWPWRVPAPGPASDPHVSRALLDRQLHEY